MSENKVKDFFEDVFLSIKNHFTSSKYIIKGKCKKCGQCCENILFSDENGYIKDEETFYRMQKNNWRLYGNFYPNGKIENEKGGVEGAIKFKCKLLKNGKCSIYWIRPLFCRDYPSINYEFIKRGGVMLDNCGFYFDVDKKFKEYLK